jgi:hypothetical protein
VRLTVAGPKGDPVPAGGTLVTDLLDALRKAGDPYVSVFVTPHVPRLFWLQADLKIDPDRVRTDVVAAVEAALRAAFSFEARAFGQAVAKSEVIAVMHGVTGVLALDLNALHRTDVGGTGAGPDELLTLDPGPIDLGVLS